MVLLGIDPGTATTGYGIVDVSSKTGQMSLIDYGKISTSKEMLMPIRLCKIYNSLKYLIDKHNPDALVIERIFFNTNAKTALSVGQARGIYMLLGGQYNKSVFEYTALEAKMELTGYGRAEKDQVRDRVTELLNIKVKIKPIDAADALAMAICHKIKIFKSK